MVYTPHQIQKAEKVADLMQGLAEAQLTIPKLFTYKTMDQFKFAKDDTLTFRVPGRLPYRKYAWRNDRTKGLFFDAYKEGKTTVTVGDRIYSGVELTDEQMDFDLGSWATPAQLQADAVVQGFQDEAVKALETAPYKVTIGLNGNDSAATMKRAFFEARRVLNGFRVPKEQRFAVAGSNAAMVVLDVAAQIPGRADAALANGTIGRIAGFDCFEDESIDADVIYFFVPSAFVLYNDAPSVPQSAPFGKVINGNGVKMRWIRDYDQRFQVERSTLTTYVSTAPVKDLFFKKSVYTQQESTVILDPGTTQEFVRGIKLDLGLAASVYPAAASALAVESGISDANPFTVA